MSLSLRGLTAALALAAASAADATTIRTGFDGATLDRNDDESTVAVALGFTANFFGVTETSLYVNNNGNVTFAGPESTYTPYGLTAVTHPIIAPFFADVDTRFVGQPVTYGTGAVDGHAAFGVNWLDVDYFNGALGHSARNSFQLVLIDRSDLGLGNFDFEFNYGAIQWETGTAASSGGDADGLGGNSARVGFSNGNGTSFEFAGSGVNGAFLDGGANALVAGSNIDLAGRYLFQVRSGAVVNPPSEVPVPASLPLMLVGPLVLAGLRRRKRG